MKSKLINSKLKLIPISLIISLFVFLVIYCFLSANYGRVFDDNKTFYLDQIPDPWRIPYQLIDTKNPNLNLDYPVVFKPNRCTGCGLNVKRIDSSPDAQKYLYETTETEVIAQKLDTRAREFSILYERNPFLSHGRIIALVEKIPVEKNTYFTIYKIGLNDRKSNVVDYTSAVTPEFEQLIDGLTQRIPETYVGRYDVKADDLESLLNGHFGVLEFNGLMGLDLRAFVETVNEIDHQNFMIQIRWFLKRAWVGLQAQLTAPRQILNQLKSTNLECEDYFKIYSKNLSRALVVILCVILCVILSFVF